MRKLQNLVFKVNNIESNYIIKQKIKMKLALITNINSLNTKIMHYVVDINFFVCYHMNKLITNIINNERKGVIDGN